jgi:hypothetical protein
MKRFAILILTAVFSTPLLAAPQTYVIERTLTYPYLSYSYFGYSTRLSRIDKTSGTVLIDFEEFLRRVGVISSNRDQ